MLFFANLRTNCTDYILNISSGPIEKDITNLPHDLVMQLMDAASSANIDMLIKLIARIEPENSELANRLMDLVSNYDYKYLQKILIRKETL